MGEPESDRFVVCRRCGYVGDMDRDCAELPEREWEMDPYTEHFVPRFEFVCPNCGARYGL